MSRRPKAPTRLPTRRSRRRCSGPSDRHDVTPSRVAACNRKFVIDVTHKFGNQLESVQLETGLNLTGATLKGKGSPEDEIGVEFSAGLGFSLAVDGRVAHWTRPHGINIFGEEHPEMKTAAFIDPLSDPPTTESVVRSAADWIEGVHSTSYRALRSSRPIGFVQAPTDVEEIST
jgi:hypothetical protein